MPQILEPALFRDEKPAADLIRQYRVACGNYPQDLGSLGSEQIPELHCGHDVIPIRYWTPADAGPRLAFDYGGCSHIYSLDDDNWREED